MYIEILEIYSVSLSFGSRVRKMLGTEAPERPPRPPPPPRPRDGSPTWNCKNKSQYFLWAVSQLKLIIACLPDSCFICGPRASLGRKQRRSGHCLRVCAPWSGGGEVRREVGTRVQTELQEPFEVSLPSSYDGSEKATEKCLLPPPQHLSATSIQFRPRTSLVK